jgi:uncharacterized protein
VHITWFGGEPLLEINRIKEMSIKIISACELKGVIYSASIVTNGFFLDYKSMKDLNELCNVKSVQITLDGLDEVYSIRKGTSLGSFHTVVDNITDLVKINDVIISIRINVDKENIEEAKMLTDYLLNERGLKRQVNIYLSNITNDNECMECSNTNQLLDNAQFLKLYSDFVYYIGNNNKYSSMEYFLPPQRNVNCGMQIKTNCAIDPQGFMYKCIKDIGYKDRVIGHVSVGRYCNSYEENYLNLDLHKECSDCILFPMCLGGCKYDCVNKKDDICRIDKDFLSNVINHIYSNYLKSKAHIKT